MMRMRRPETAKYNISDRFDLAPDVVITQDESSVILFHTTRGEYWRGNATTLRIIELLAQGHTVAETAEVFTREYGVDPDESLADVTRVVGGLASMTAIRRRAE